MTLSLIRLMLGRVKKDRPLMGLSVGLFLAAFLFLGMAAFGRSERDEDGGK
eukprot:CAMPEP_0197454552 /NCGR_PEP_ID=MMETSP1175-20131217/38269_1 /TAXON_ID=1003142 /ORGANISM="Triceratium dubium, Strain CCMP147" /LENGTH=50 /DNA_ID=CAMNT_0042988159 /DNA_START=115 /DNA_END=267 /DNA_ORIENTATION=-